MKAPGSCLSKAPKAALRVGSTSMWCCSGHNKAASSSPNATRGQRSRSRAIAPPPSRDDLLPHLILWLLMLGESLHQASKEPKESRAKPQKGCSEVLPAARLPRQHAAISGWLLEFIFKCFLRTKVQFGKALLAGFQNRAIKAYEMPCLKPETITL